MPHNFAELVEEVRRLSLGEQEELYGFLSKMLIDQRREDIAANHRSSLKELKTGKISFSSSVDILRDSLSDD